MGYLEKSTVMKALNEDMETTLACYDGKGEKDIIKFCYECIRIELDKLPQYVLEGEMQYDSFCGILYWSYSLHNYKCFRRTRIWEMMYRRGYSQALEDIRRKQERKKGLDE